MTTKRLTPEEDAAGLRGIGYDDGVRGDVNCDGQGTKEIVIQIDKHQAEMEITREGERFLEVRFKRRESVTMFEADGPFALSVEPTKLEGYDRHRRECAEYYRDANPVVLWPTD